MVPLWRSVPYWPLIAPDGVHIVPFDWVDFPRCRDTFRPGRLSSGLFGSKT